MSAIESVLVENRVFPPSEAIMKAARIPGMEAYNALCAEAARDFEGFWARLARDPPCREAVDLWSPCQLYEAVRGEIEERGFGDREYRGCRL